MNTSKDNFFDLDYSDIEQILIGWGEPRFRVDQVWRGLYHELKENPALLSNLPKNLAEKLNSEFSFQNLISEQSQISTDGQTKKILFRLKDNLPIETVLMRYKKRRTLCISSQSGCALGCVFCATGQMGLKRNLSSGEIVEQVLHFERFLKASEGGLTNIVVMGMGEPFHNYENTITAIKRLNHPKGLNLGARRFTVSTVGLIPQILRFTEENLQVNLAVSLHAADNDLRDSILPINRRYPIENLIEACREYTQQTHRRITFEWALILDVNDSVEQAVKLADLLRGLNCHVNIIPLNPISGYSGEATTMKRAQRFRSELESQGIPCSIRVRRGIDIQAGCGQLASET